MARCWGLTRGSFLRGHLQRSERVAGTQGTVAHPEQDQEEATACPKPEKGKEGAAAQAGAADLQKGPPAMDEEEDQSRGEASGEQGEQTPLDPAPPGSQGEGAQRLQGAEAPPLGRERLCVKQHTVTGTTTPWRTEVLKHRPAPGKISRPFSAFPNGLTPHPAHMPVLSSRADTT